MPGMPDGTQYTEFMGDSWVLMGWLIPAEGYAPLPARGTIGVFWCPNGIANTLSEMFAERLETPPKPGKTRREPAIA